MKIFTSVTRTQLVITQRDLTVAPAILVSMETDTTAQVSQYFIWVLVVVVVGP